MPKEGSVVKFGNLKEIVFKPFVIYADFECRLKKVNIKKGEKTTQTQIHKSSGYCLRFVSGVDSSESRTIQYTAKTDDENVALHFIRTVTDLVYKIGKKYAEERPMLITEEETFGNATRCWVEWVRSFLSNRKQRVRIGSSTSCYQQVNGGVPQGTVLGPILFMIMINDLLKDWESWWKYVDDTTLSETVIVNEESVLQCTLDGINLWCEENDMVLNTRKCKQILICFWKKKPNFQQLTVNNYPVEHVNSAKLLGVMLSSDLKWNEHVAYIKKSSRRLYMLRLLKRANADKKTLIAVYRTCIRPILEYCNQIWHFNIPEYLSNDIERIQRRALKIIHPSLSYNEALVVCNMSTLHLRREQLCQLFFKKRWSQVPVHYQSW